MCQPDGIPVNHVSVSLTSRNVEESENSPESPQLGEIKHMRKQCVPGAPPFLPHAGDEAIVSRAI